MEKSLIDVRCGKLPQKDLDFRKVHFVDRISLKDGYSFPSIVGRYGSLEQKVIDLRDGPGFLDPDIYLKNVNLRI